MFSKQTDVSKNFKSENVLKELSSNKDVNGGTTTLPCVGITVSVTVSVCPTTKCTSKCH